jgi:hypothetical protein
MTSVAVLGETLGVTAAVAQVGKVDPPLLLLAQEEMVPYSLEPVANVSTWRIAPMFESFST